MICSFSQRVFSQLPVSSLFLPSLHTHLKSSPLFLSSSTSSLESSSCHVAVRSRSSLPSRSSCPGRIIPTIRSAATKPCRQADEDWKTKREVLLQKKVRSVDAKEALRLQQEKTFIIFDVRPEAEAHPPGAINIQIYRLIKEWTAWDIARRAAFAFFGIFAGTEENPDFMQSVESQIRKDAKIIVACTAGGTMKPSQSLPEGQQWRSLIAAYLLVLNGYTNVYHLGGGLYTWFKEGLPAVSEEEDIPPSPKKLT